MFGGLPVKVSNTDNPFRFLSKKHDVSLKIDKDSNEFDKQQKLRYRGVEIMDEQINHWADSLLCIIFDATGNQLYKKK